ncbi:hypothetical protein BPTFM16_01244 [Altererythrobacter insulae]|nr:hypothetical protein BPTFM16_01244 [Altererythrobacter insulae]
MTKTTAVIAAASLALAVSSAPAIADDNVAQVEVTYADLNLDSPAGQQILERRLRNAVEIACGGPAQPNLAFGRAVHKCIKNTMPKAQAEAELAVANYKTQRLAVRDRKVRFAIR